MDLPTQNHLTTLRSLLTYRLHELESDINAAQVHDTAVSVEPSEVRDRQDEAVRAQTGEIDEAQERRDMEEIGLVKAALHRLDTGTYGGCLDCGADIGLQRLLVQPAASRCAACQAAREQSK
ncbi:TraR/DksA family transcriptional regulator [Aquabacterium sp. CECT 9606]|uniref:TraR/DksA family transcriptional regulator n=1 Tax=Aquabacterium sp. CECT 9606 TaxID=2845822 RepID=UPI001E32CE83|nr:TraR/DksA family transcriptional regulator [Aquabacterium sp. CECT 9606]CAH0351734.1 RNA polymerase-binding transcription factor DksA [Aquabacterium sp. CECT 9606]